MIFSLAEVIIACMLGDWVFRRLHLPGFVGMLLVGFAFGPNGLDLLHPSLLQIGTDLRIMALIVIMLRAGFSLRPKVVGELGWPVVWLSFVPSLLEAVAVTVAARHLLNLQWQEAAMLGFIIPAVSPAVIVPLMIDLIERSTGAAKRVPTLVLAASSLDNIFNVIVADILFRCYADQKNSIGASLAVVPVAVIAGVLVGWGFGRLLVGFFERFNPRATKRALLLIAAALTFHHVEKASAGAIPFSSLVAVLIVGGVVAEQRAHYAHEILSKLGKIWVFAEVALFAIVGAEFKPAAALQAGMLGLVVILCGVIVRMVGVALSTRSSCPVSVQAFVAISFLPKASVQAALAGMPLAIMRQLGFDSAPGEIILALGVLSIILTAPLGAWLIPIMARRLETGEAVPRPGEPRPEAGSA